MDLLTDVLSDAIATVVRVGDREPGHRHDHDEGTVVVMADPEGHEFCLVHYATGASRTGRG